MVIEALPMTSLPSFSAVDLWDDPCLQEVGPDQNVQLKQAMPEISTTEALPADKRSLFHAGRSRRHLTMEKWMPKGNPLRPGS